MNHQAPETVLRLLLAAATAALIAGCTGEVAVEREEVTAQRSAMHAQPVDQLFDDADTDKNGTLSSSEIEAVHGSRPMLAAHFAEIDSDGDRELSRDEIAAAMEKHHGAGMWHGAGAIAHEEHLKRFDTDGDGQLSASERRAVHEQMFDETDTDNNGTLSASELAAAPGPGRMLAAHLADIDSNGDGELSYDEIAAAMEKRHGGAAAH